MRSLSKIRPLGHYLLVGVVVATSLSSIVYAASGFRLISLYGTNFASFFDDGGANVGVEATSFHVKGNDTYLSSPVDGTNRISGTTYLSGNTYFGTVGSNTGVVTASGYIGIGTSSPQKQLQIHGSTEAATLYTNPTSGASSTDGLFVGLNTNGIDTTLWNFENGYLRFATNNTERMRIDNAGNVGIGTTSPGEKLQVGGNIKLSGNNRIYNGDSNFHIDSAANGSLYLNYFTGNGVYFGNGASGVNGVWLSNGNVGIGTTSPGDKLNISQNWFDASSTDFGGGIRLTGNAPTLSFYDTDNTNNKYMIHSNSEALHFYRRPNGGGFDDMAYFDANGHIITNHNLYLNGGSLQATSNTVQNINAGNSGRDYLPASGNWNYTMLLNALDTSSIGFHNAGHSVASIRYGNNGFTIGADDGWGNMPVRTPGGIKDLPTPTLASDAANKAYVDAAVSAAGGGLTLYKSDGTTEVGKFIALGRDYYESADQTDGCDNIMYSNGGIITKVGRGNCETSNAYVYSTDLYYTTSDCSGTYTYIPGNVGYTYSSYKKVNGAFSLGFGSSNCVGGSTVMYSRKAAATGVCSAGSWTQFNQGCAYSNSDWHRFSSVTYTARTCGVGKCQIK